VQAASHRHVMDRIQAQSTGTDLKLGIRLCRCMMSPYRVPWSQNGLRRACEISIHVRISSTNGGLVMVLSAHLLNVVSYIRIPGRLTCGGSHTSVPARASPSGSPTSSTIGLIVVPLCRGEITMGSQFGYIV
jgi:hypothetical protein